MYCSIARHAARWCTAVALVATILPAQAAGPALRAAEPDAAVTFDKDTAMWLVTLPLGCIDKLHAPPRGRGYVYESAVTLKPGFDKTRAFYGCFDWHSAVNSTWTMVRILKSHPDLPVARLVREKLSEHLPPTRSRARSPSSARKATRRSSGRTGGPGCCASTPS